MNKANISLKKLEQIESNIDLADKDDLETIVKVLNIDLDMIG